MAGLLAGALNAEVAPEDIGSGNPLVVGASLLVLLLTAVPLTQWPSSEPDRRSIEGVTENSCARKTMQDAINLKAFQIGLANLAPPLHRLRFVMWYFGIADVVLGAVTVVGVFTQSRLHACAPRRALCSSTGCWWCSRWWLSEQERQGTPLATLGSNVSLDGAPVPARRTASVTSSFSDSLIHCRRGRDHPPLRRAP